MKYEPLSVEHLDDSRFLVASEVDSSKRYLVDFGHDGRPCDCPDAVARKRQCKHQKAVIWFLGNKVAQQLNAKKTNKKTVKG